jgi:hypothetical protein
MMNESARVIFSELLDVNYDFSQMEGNLSASNIQDYIKLGKRVSSLRAAFEAEMGEGYQKFMDDGARMFAPKA